MKNILNRGDRIFIAGHKGMVGSSIYRLFQEKGYGNLLTVKRQDLDLRDFIKVKNWFNEEKPDVVILAAAVVGGINANNIYPTKFILDNLKIQNNIIENSWKSEVKRLLFLGSSCIYPKSSKQPIREEYLMGGKLEETNQWYATAKISGIQLCNALRIEHNFNAISLMPTNLYGPGDNYNNNHSHVLPGLIRRFYEAKLNNISSVTCWGTGEPLREFLHVSDLAEACHHTLKYWDPLSDNAPKDEEGKILGFLNVGTGIDISIKELSKKIARSIDYKGEINWDTSKPDGTYKKQLDISRIKELGWYPKINIDEGIEITIEDFKKNFYLKNFRS